MVNVVKIMNFLNNPNRYLFFTGKGGVGKTSIACATAVKLANKGKKVLLVSTDPASNICQVFGIEIGNKITVIPDVPGLSALEIDPQAAAQNYRDRIVGPVRGILPEDVVRGIEEQLSGACTTEIAAFDEFTSLLVNSELTVIYNHIIFDTAPTGHTIRLLSLPGAWSGFLEEGKGDASCLGPLSGLEKQRSQYKLAVSALSNPSLSSLILVARAQKSTLVEAARTHQELASIGLSKQFLVINGVLSENKISNDSLARALFIREQKAIEDIPAAIKMLERDVIPLKSFNLVGIEALQNLFDNEVTSSNETKDNLPFELPFDVPSISKLVDQMSADKHGLIMLMGKGGVGKTTMAAAIAVSLAEKGFPVHLSTSDPAAHLSETLNGSIENLTISRIDPFAETEKYRKHVLETKGHSLDPEGRALLEEDLRSPCTEEIAVFQAFSRIIKEAGEKFVVMDTAPTGHTLLLLDATGAYHKEVTRQLGENEKSVLTPMMQLQDQKQTKIILVTLAETTPVLEAAHLQEDLLRAGITPWGWIINNSIAASRPSAPFLKVRAKNELNEINKVATRYSKNYAVVPLMREEPSGVDELLRLVKLDIPNII